MSEIGPVDQPGYVPPSFDENVYYDNPQWEASIEVHLRKLDTKTTVAIACGIAGMGLGLVANFLTKKLVDSLTQTTSIVGQLYQIEQSRGTFGGPIEVPSASTPGAHMASDPSQSWGAIRPNTSHIGRTTPAPGAEVIDESQQPYRGDIAPAQEGPSSGVTDVVKDLIAHDAIRPADIAKGDGNVR